MGSFFDALGALQKVLVIKEGVERLETDIGNLANEMSRVREYAGEIDRRVARIEGTFDGLAMAKNVNRPQPNQNAITDEAPDR